VSLGCSNRLPVEFELVPGQSIAKHGGDLTLKALNHIGPELDDPVVCNVDQMIFVFVPDQSIAARTRRETCGARSAQTQLIAAKSDREWLEKCGG